MGKRAGFVSQSANGLQVAWVAISKVKPYAKNPRNNEAAIDKVAASLREFGWRQPIVVDREHVVVAGHTRLEAARRLGMARVPVHVARDLTAAQAKAYRLADNRTAQEAEWISELLSEELRELQGSGFDLALTGFDPDEIGALTEADSQLLEGSDPDDAPSLPEKAKTKPGDVVELGRHRLVCGDSTDTGTWEQLLGGKPVQMAWTDPPYGVEYVGKTSKALTVLNDEAAGLRGLLLAAFGAVAKYAQPSTPIYVAAPAGPLHLDFLLAFKGSGLRLHQVLVWVKDAMVLGHSDYHWRHEPIIYGYTPGGGRPGRGAHAGSRWQGDHAETSVFEIPRPKTSVEHPTMKPVELVARAIRNSSKPGAIVADPFGGSGTTLIACEQERRVARLIELDPRYCDVIVQRWEKATGEKAKRPR